VPEYGESEVFTVDDAEVFGVEKLLTFSGELIEIDFEDGRHGARV
jgi:hypothetical protein